MAILGIDFLRAFKLSVDPAVGRLVQSGTGLILSTISLSSGPTVSAIVSSSDPGSLGQVATSAKNNTSVPGPDGQAISSPSAGPGPDGQAVSSPSAGPGPDGKAVSSSSSTVTGCRPRAAGGGRLASQLPIFFQLLLQRYQDVVNLSKVLLASSHGVVHHLRTTGPPIASPFRRLDAEKLAAAKADFMKMEAEGIIRRSSSPWASPLHLVKKLDGSWRPCGDFRRLNNVTVPDTYPLSNMMDFSARVTGSKFFSKIDLRKGYFQILCIQMTFLRRPSSPHLASSNFCAFHLACGMLEVPSSG
jgi:hypothetical protein